MSKQHDLFVWKTRLFVVLKRVCTRVIDLEYFRVNQAYALEILQLAEDSGDEDLLNIAAHLRDLMERMPAKASAPAVVDEAPVSKAQLEAVVEEMAHKVAEQLVRTGQVHVDGHPSDTSRYVGSLR